MKISDNAIEFTKDELMGYLTEIEMSHSHSIVIPVITYKNNISITKITIGFAAEMVFFISVGGFLANGMFAYSLICLIVAMLLAGYTGKRIEEDAIERYEDAREFAERLINESKKNKR